MGIKYFFSWFKKNFENHIRTLKPTDNFNVDIDTFLVDLNGIFHYCAQKVFRYGNFKIKDGSKPEYKYSYTKQLKYLNMQVGFYITKLIKFVKPKKRVCLCIDGVAPVSKQFQQRQRRFKSALDRNDDTEFDSNCITPGTKFMDSLSNYLEWYIRNELSTNESMQHLEIIFSNEKSPGEGEHKLVKFVRDFGKEDESFMLHGMDADLIMLSLASHKTDFHILRENPYKNYNEFFYIDMKSIRNSLINILTLGKNVNPEKFYINDFILMMFMSGNDFLPHLPSIDILDGSIEEFLDVYNSTVSSYGNIVSQCNTINLKPLSILMNTLGQNEIKVLQEKRKKVNDILLEKHTTLGADGEFILDFDNYRKEYYEKKLKCFTEKDIQKACNEYIKGMQWVLTYYLEGVSCWKWFYPYFYSPFCSDIMKYSIGKMSDRVVSLEKPLDPFFQLLCVLPPKSFKLLPEPLPKIMKSLSQFYPEEFILDMDGKRNEWEAVVILPALDHKIMFKEYTKLLKMVELRDKHRNKINKSIVFNVTDQSYFYKSYFGDIPDCKIKTEFLNF